MSVRPYLLATPALFAIASSAGLVACSALGASDGSSASASSSTTLSPAVGTDVAAGPAQTQQQDAVVAAGNGQYLAAWTDAPGPSSHIMAARVDASGTLLDARSIALPRASSGNDVNPAIAWNGASYLVVWEHVGTGGSNILAARVGSDGKVQDTTPWTITSAKAGLPAVAWNGAEFLVTWSDQRGGVADVYGARFSATGAPIGSELRISTTAGTSGKPSAVAANGSAFLVAWDEGGSGIFGARVQSGAVVDANAIALSSFSGHSYAPSIASNGNNWLVSWFDYDAAASTSAVSALRLSGDGTKLDASPMSVAQAGGGHPSVAWDGDAYAVAWKNGARRIGADGQPVGSALNGKSGTNDSRPGIAGNASGIFVVRGADSHGLLPGQLSTQATGTLYPKAGGDPSKASIALSRGDAAQRQVAAAFDGTSWLAVWQEYRTDWDHPELWAALYKQTGALVTSPGFKLREGANMPSLPSVIFDGTKYLVGWQEQTADGSLHNATVAVNKDGSLASTPSLANGSKGGLVQVGSKSILAIDGNGYLVTNGVADTSRSLFERGDDPGFTIATEAAPVWTGNSLVLVWGAYQGTTYEIHSVRFSPQLQKLDAAPVRIASFAMGSRLPVVKAAGDGHGRTLVAWEDVNAGAIMGMRLSDAAPVRLDNAGAGMHAYVPSVIWDGATWLVAYESRQSLAPDAAGSGLYFTTWTAGGAPGAATSIATTNGAAPLLAPGVGGATFVGYEGSATGTSRIGMRMFTDQAAPPPPPPPPPPGSSSGTVNPGDDDDSTGTPGTPGGGDDDDNKPAGGNPKKPEPKPVVATAPTKKTDTGAATPKSGGCNTTSSSSSGESAWMLVAIGALLVRRRRLS